VGWSEGSAHCETLAQAERPEMGAAMPRDSRTQRRPLSSWGRRRETGVLVAPASRRHCIGV